MGLDRQKFVILKGRTSMMDISLSVGLKGQTAPFSRLFEMATPCWMRQMCYLITHRRKGEINGYSLSRDGSLGGSFYYMREVQASLAISPTRTS